MKCTLAPVVCCLLMIVVGAVVPLEGQQQFFITTLRVRPTVTSGQTTLDIYNAHLSPGGFNSLRLCSTSGEVLQDLTDRVDASKQGLQSLDVDLSKWSTGMYYLVYVSRLEVVTVKVSRLR